MEVKETATNAFLNRQGKALVLGLDLSLQQLRKANGKCCLGAITSSHPPF